VLFQTKEKQIKRKTANVATVSDRSKPNLQMNKDVHDEIDDKLVYDLFFESNVAS
jgi:hypothetical protein